MRISAWREHHALDVVLCHALNHFLGGTNVSVAVDTVHNLCDQVTSGQLCQLSAGIRLRLHVSPLTTCVHISLPLSVQINT